jgi:mannose-6-phosphate isomerase-like protein (cupin superfamily)
MKRFGAVLSLLLGSGMMWAQSGAPAPAAGATTPDGVTVWVNGVPPAGAPRANFGDTHAMMISHRVATQPVEVHLGVADVVVVQSGTATLVTGGEVVDPVTKSPNELGGASIKGGVSRTVTAGDVVEIPPGVPHQYLIAPGGQITYLLVKVTKR